MSTGCGTYGLETGITLPGDLGNDYYWGLPGSCVGSSTDYPDADLITEYGSNFIEISLGLSTLDLYGIELDTITIRPCCDSGLQANYTLTTVPVPASGYLFVLGLLGLVVMRKQNIND